MERNYYSFIVEGEKPNSDLDLVLIGYQRNKVTNDLFKETVEFQKKGNGLFKKKVEIKSETPIGPQEIAPILDSFFIETLKTKKEISLFLEYHFESFKGEKIIFLEHTKRIVEEAIIIWEMIDKKSNGGTDGCYSVPRFHKFAKLSFTQVLEWIDKKFETLDSVPKENGINKLKWNCSPSILGHLITELAKKGYIEYPLYNGEPNYTGMGRVCFQIFDIDSKENNFIRECNPNLNSLSETKKHKFSSLPDLKDLT